MEFFNIEMSSGLLARRTNEELLEAFIDAQAAGRHRKAARLWGRVAKRVAQDDMTNKYGVQF